VSEPARTNPSPTPADAIEDEVQEALAICGGDAIAALRITLIANAFLEAEVDRLSAAGEAQECQSEGTAIRRAEGMSRDSANAGAVAFKRAGDPNIGEFRMRSC
jgi:hypothetical protein